MQNDGTKMNQEKAKQFEHYVSQREEKLWLEGLDLVKRHEPFVNQHSAAKHATAFSEYLGHERLSDIGPALGLYLKAGFPKPETTQSRFWANSCYAHPQRHPYRVTISWQEVFLYSEANKHWLLWLAPSQLAFRWAAIGRT